jgi:hypothetical protein
MMAPPLNTGVVAGDEGVEPSSADLEAAMLPLHQSPLARSAGIEPATSRVEAGCSDPLSYERLARRVGFEPTTSGSEARRTDPLCYRRVCGEGALYLLCFVRPHYLGVLSYRPLGLAGLEPTTSPIREVTFASGAGVCVRSVDADTWSTNYT